MQDSLVSNKVLRGLRDFPHVPFVFHFTPDSVFQSEKYQRWMDETFPKGKRENLSSHKELSQKKKATLYFLLIEACTRHVLLNVGSGFSSSDLLCYTERLAAISPEGTFPDLAELHGIRKEEEEENERLIRTRSGMRFHVHPAEKVDSTQVGFSL